MITAQWLNRLVVDMWPYYDKAAGQAIREAVEPMMEQYKPPGLIKRIYFKTLTFGDAPIRIDNVWVEDEGEEHVLMEARPLACILLPPGKEAGHCMGPVQLVTAHLVHPTCSDGFPHLVRLLCLSHKVCTLCACVCMVTRW